MERNTSNLVNKLILLEDKIFQIKLAIRKINLHNRKYYTIFLSIFLIIRRTFIIMISHSITTTTIIDNIHFPLKYQLVYRLKFNKSITVGYYFQSMGENNTPIFLNNHQL